MFKNHRTELTVSIINFRTPELTIKCAQSVLQNMDDVLGHIVVVDNCSGDDSVDVIGQWIDGLGHNPRVTLVRSSRNGGFSAGHNLGMTAQPADYHLLLNSDCVILPGCLQALLTKAKANPDAGFVTPQLEDPDGTVQISHFRFFSILGELVRAAASRPISRLLPKSELALAPMLAPQEIDWASFACVVLRRDMLLALGPMDEGYFLYFEDSAYCWHARQAGWRIVHSPSARAVHLRGGSGPVKQLTNARERLPAYYYASRTRFFYQSRGRLGLLAANLAWHLGRLIARSRVLVGREVPQMAKAEARDIWTNFLRPLGPNREPRG
ncbi:MAG: glycosyltransferase family 2 protein [Paracoccaceae bacterium]